MEVRRLLAPEPRRPAARDRGDELRRDRARLGERRPRPSRVRQAVRGDELPGGERGASSSVAGRARPTSRRSARIHVLSVEGGLRGPVEWETDRARFLGRGRELRAPLALEGQPLSGSTGTVLDPVASLRYRVRLAAGRLRADVVRDGRDGERRRPRGRWPRSTTTRARRRGPSPSPSPTPRSRCTTSGIASDEAQLFERLASRVLYADAVAARRSRASRARNTLGQAGLWPHGISGDVPILLLRVVEENDLPLARQVLQAQQYWRLKGMSADVVILNEHPVSYLDEMHEALVSLLASGPWSAIQHRPGGVHLLRADNLTESDRLLLGAAAAVVLSGERGELDEPARPPLPRAAAGRPRWRFERSGRVPSCRRLRSISRRSSWRTASAASARAAGSTWWFWRATRRRPLPWTNVLANPGFGTLVTASGSAFTWAGNSRENRLTPFANDPVADPTAEAIYLRDEDDGHIAGFHPSAERRSAKSGRFVVRHAPGVTRFAALAPRSAPGARGLRGEGSAREAVARHRRPTTLPAGGGFPLRLLGVDALPAAAGGSRARGDGAGRGDGCGARPQPLQSRLPGPRRVRGRQRAADSPARATAWSSWGATAA